ncbi:MAG: outer membrane lipoprotein carrier protein LolA [Deltaproteobacteria bacterium]|nr:outer membrane lipoprotein carrier protein LolA [Deltaproteobacteria bacterium]
MTGRLSLSIFFIWAITLVLPCPGNAGSAGSRVNEQHANAGSACSKRKDLVRKLSLLRTMRCSFKEVKTLEMLDEPLITRGRMYYMKPGFVHQDMTSPARQSVTIAGGKLKVTNLDLNKSEIMNLSKSKSAQAAVQSVVQVMSGRAALLEDQYECMLSNMGRIVRIILIPRTGLLKKMISRIVVTFDSSLVIKKVEIDEKKGDKSVMTFTDVVYNKPFSKEEMSKYFDL